MKRQVVLSGFVALGYLTGGLIVKGKDAILDSLAYALILALITFGFLRAGTWFLGPRGGQSPVFIPEKDEDNPWAKCVGVDYDKYLAMRDKCIADLRELPDQDTPQIMGFGGSWSPKHLAQQITDQTTVGKKYVEMMVKSEEDDNKEENENE